MTIRIKNLRYDTTPCVLHHNGGASICRHGLEFKRHYFDLIGQSGRHFRYSKNGKAKVLHTCRRPLARRPLRPIPNLSVVTWTSYRFPGSAQLSFEHFGVPMEVIRPREPYSNRKRIGWLRDYLDAVDTDYVLVMDSHDTFVTSDVHGIVDGFRALGCRMLFQAEGNDWPPADELKDYYDRLAPPDAAYAYICAGIFMGEREFMKRVVDRALETPPIREHSDQGIYKQVFREFHPEVQLDYRCQLFQPLTDYKHRDRPDDYRPIDLCLEIRFQPDEAAAPDPKALTPAKALQWAPYRLGRWWEGLLDRFSR